MNNLKKIFCTYHLIFIIPIVYAIHMLEESFGFVHWVNVNISPHFTTTNFHRNNLLMFVASVSISFIAFKIQNRITAFLVTSWVFGLILNNAFFHIGGTLFFKKYSPGILSSMFIYLPFSLFLLRIMLKEKRLRINELVSSFFLGAICHYGFIYLDVLSS
ncbi:HXXEE domain-containing protein [Desulfobacter vibrioformis]|uniref:HXXEE domain-containing protein n=1 Tax=Desulfobacter vibrioformis TaxID=34031 RepID=UPI000551B6F0